jgi:hypothetical protein
MAESVPAPEIVRGVRCPVCDRESLVLRAGDESRDRVSKRGEHLACTTDGCTYVYDLKTKVNVD